MTRPAPAPSIAAVCPPRPSVASTYTPSGRGARNETTSAASTGSCSASDAKLRERSGVVIRKRLALQLRQEALVVPHLEVLHLAQHIHIARHAGGVAQPPRNEHAALLIQLAHLAEVADAIEVLQAGRVTAGHLGQALFERPPDRHWIDAHRVAGQAGEVQAESVLPAIHQAPEPVRDFEA